MKRRAFTLIEMTLVASTLVVIGAMMLPTVANARLIATRMRCGTNMRGLAVALQSYFLDSNGQKPVYGCDANRPTTTFTMTGTYRMFEFLWPVALSPYLNIPSVANRPLSPDSNGRYYSFVQQMYQGSVLRSSLFCPADTVNLPTIDWSNIPADGNYMTLNRSTYGAVAGNWMPGSIQSFQDDYWVYNVNGLTQGPFTSDPTSFAPNGSTTRNANLFGRSLSQKAPSTPVFGHMLGSVNGPTNSPGSLAFGSTINEAWQRTNFGYNLPNSPTTVARSHNNILPFSYLDGHVEMISASAIRTDYFAGGGLNGSGPCGPTPLNSSFTADYGQNGGQPIYDVANSGNGPWNSNAGLVPWP